MRYYHPTDDCESRLVVVDGNTTYDLTAARSRLTSFRDLVKTASIANDSIDAVTERLLPEATQIDRPMESVAPPVEASEIWAAGVTYEVSEEARQAESGRPEVYQQVYDADRPEIFFKATPSRTVGSGDDVGIRSDSDWNIPEPELAVVLYDGEIVGYTIGNDVSSRSIEGENPLYLPQAKVYDRCCSIGPCVVSATSIEDPHDLSISMTVIRDGKTVFAGETSTAQMVTSCEKLTSYYVRSTPVPECAVLLTGTSLVPDEEFTLTDGDTIDIAIDEIGHLRNGVTTV